MKLLLFLLSVFLISFSGAIAPGPVGTATVVMGAKNKYAGVLIAIGHAIIEVPLIILITLGIGRIFESKRILIALGFIGGAVLLYMGLQMLRSNISAEGEQETKISAGNPVITGIVLSASNPYFTLWWVTIGLGLATTAKTFGTWAFLMFILAHWSTDLIWFSLVSLASYKGTKIMGPAVFRKVIIGCGVVMLIFGVMFIEDAVEKTVDCLRDKSDSQSESEQAESTESITAVRFTSSTRLSTPSFCIM